MRLPTKYKDCANAVKKNLKVLKMRLYINVIAVPQKLTSHQRLFSIKMLNVLYKNNSKR